MTAIYDNAGKYDSFTQQYDGGGCTSTITYDEIGAGYDAAITYDGCDHRATAPITAQRPGAAKFEISHQTRAWWESEALRLRIIRDDEELLCLV